MLEKENKKKFELNKRAIKIVETKIGLLSNTKSLIYQPECLNKLVGPISPAIWNIHTAIHKFKESKSDSSLDGQITLIDKPNLKPQLLLTENNLFFTDNISRSEEDAQDKRYSIFGNLGLLFRFSLYLLERKNIYSFHASSIFHEDRKEFILFIGGPGSGKTVLILEGLLHRGYKLFSTEMTHVKLSRRGCYFFKGALWDNIRLGTLAFDFPELLFQMNVELSESDDLWQTKNALDLRAYQTEKDKLLNPSIIIIFPRIESGKNEVSFNSNPSEHFVFRTLYQNLSEKIDQDFFLYNHKLPFRLEKNPKMLEERANFIDKFIKLPEIKRKVILFSGASNCWEWY